MKTALITGITGQDGSYLAEIAEKSIVHGIKRRTSLFNTARIDISINHLKIRTKILSTSWRYDRSSSLNIIQKLNLMKFII